MIALIFQVAGAILLAKGLIFRKEIDVFLNIYSFAYLIKGKRNGRMYLFFKESYLSKIGAISLIVGYFFPVLGWEYDINKLELQWRLIIGALGIALILVAAKFISGFLAKKKSNKLPNDYLLDKYSKEVKEMGFVPFGMEE